MVHHDQLATDGATDVVFCSEPTPGARYGSGQHFYDEQLIRGRFVGRVRAAVGRVKYTQGIDALLDRMVGCRPIEAFQLVVDGFALSGQGRWQAARDEPLPDTPGPRHAAIDLARAVRPVRVAVHTRLDGTELRAISAVDVVLWDVFGEYTGQPIYILLGGRNRDGMLTLEERLALGTALRDEVPRRPDVHIEVSDEQHYFDAPRG